MKYLVVLFLCIKFCLGQDLFPVIRIKDGDVVGQRYDTNFPVNPVINYLRFYGMPYAQPPIGTLRFQAPLPVVPWTGIANTILPGNFCAQFVEEEYIGDEDCLYLDVHTPSIPQDQNASYSVMVWIHRREMGSGFVFNPDLLVAKNIVLVSVDYRMGFFGFFSTGDAAAYGNNGLKDLVMALRWVKDNIIYFNGDPNRITIFGEGYAHYLQLSPLATGLFHQIIVMNSCVLNPGHLQTNMQMYVDNLAAYLNISTASSTAFVAELQQYPASNLTILQANASSLIPGFPTSPHPFVPIIEVDHPGAFITRPPAEMLAAGNYNHVPYMFGYLDRADTIILDNISLPLLDLDPTMLVSISMNEPTNYTIVASLIKDFFFGPVDIISDNIDGVIRLLTNEFFTFGLRKALEFQRMYDEGFFYRFTYKAHNVSEYYYDIWYFSNDTPYFWWIWTIDYPRFSARDFRMIDEFTTILTNFAKFGNPAPIGDPVLGNISWPKVTATEVGFLDIAEELIPGNNPNQTEFDFWAFVFNTYGNPPFATF